MKYFRNKWPCFQVFLNEACCRAAFSAIYRLLIYIYIKIMVTLWVLWQWQQIVIQFVRISFSEQMENFVDDRSNRSVQDIYCTVKEFMNFCPCLHTCHGRVYCMLAILKVMLSHRCASIGTAAGNILACMFLLP